MLSEENYDDFIGQNSSNYKWMKPTQNSLRGKNKKFNGRGKSHFRYGCSNNIVRNIPPSLGSIFSELAVSGKLSPCRRLDGLC